MCAQQPNGMFSSSCPPTYTHKYTHAHAHAHNTHTQNQLITPTNDSQAIAWASLSESSFQGRRSLGRDKLPARVCTCVSLPCCMPHIQCIKDQVPTLAYPEDCTLVVTEHVSFVGCSGLRSSQSIPTSAFLFSCD